jgi:protein-disulfide isomerase
MSTKKSKPYKVSGAKARLIAQREAEAAAARKRRRDTAISLVVIVAVLIGVVSLYGWYQATKKPVAQAVDSASAGTSASLDFAPVTVTDGQGLTLGVAGAPNVVTVYTDVACSHCAEFETTYGATLANLRDTGRIDIEYWPLGFISAGSARASNAMACAAERDPRFAVNLYDGFFANFTTDWSNDQILSLATQLNPTLPAGYETCVTAGTHAGWVTGIYNLAKTGAASNGTPTVYVNGTAFDLTTGTAQTLEGSLK